MVTEYPLDCRRKARDEMEMPFPNEETTPPVKKMYFLGFIIILF